VQSVLELDAGGAVVAADANQLQQVVIDLVQHAQRATLLPNAADRRVEVRTRLLHDAAEVSVSDRGPHLSPDETARLFLPSFSRADSAEFGLYKARLIVHRHGGWLDAQSRPGHGTTFTARFPVQAVGGPR
jgi:signal transduction histidine kinase